MRHEFTLAGPRHAIHQSARHTAPSQLSQCGNEVCHTFIRAGQIEFLGDCTHALKGQTIPLPPLPDWVLRSDT